MRKTAREGNGIRERQQTPPPSGKPGEAVPMAAGQDDAGKAQYDEAGKVLYEERQKLLEGLWMPPGPPWEELREEVKERWRRNAQDSS